MLHSGLLNNLFLFIEFNSLHHSLLRIKKHRNQKIDSGVLQNGSFLLPFNNLCVVKFIGCSYLQIIQTL